MSLSGDSPGILGEPILHWVGLSLFIMENSVQPQSLEQPIPNISLPTGPDALPCPAENHCLLYCYLELTEPTWPFTTTMCSCKCFLHFWCASHLWHPSPCLTTTDHWQCLMTCLNSLALTELLNQKCLQLPHANKSTFFFCEVLSKQHKKENAGQFYSRNIIPRASG